MIMDYTAPTNDISIRMQIMQEYLAATEAAAALTIWLTAAVRQGSARSKIRPFEQSFTRLFILTKHLAQMRDEPSAKYIETWVWMKAENKYRPQNLKAALRLFEDWRQALIEQNILEFR